MLKEFTEKFDFFDGGGGGGGGQGGERGFTKNQYMGEIALKSACRGGHNFI